MTLTVLPWKNTGIAKFSVLSISQIRMYVCTTVAINGADQYAIQRKKLEALSILTQVNLMPTNLNPFCSNRLTISPTRPRWTPSGLIMIKVRSRSGASAIVADTGPGQVSSTNGSKVRTEDTRTVATTRDRSRRARGVCEGLIIM